MMWLQAAWDFPVLRRLCVRRALRLANEPEHALRITECLEVCDDTKKFRAAADLELSWLALEMKISAQDFGPGGGLIFEQRRCAR